MSPLRPCFAILAALLWQAAAGRSLHGAALEITIQHSFNGNPLLLDSLRYANSARETLSVTRLSYLLSGFALEKAEGTWVEFPDQHAWMDLEKQRISLVLRDAPAERYRALRFHLGPDAANNNAPPASWPADHPLNINANGLYWSMQGGYIFLALEGRYRSADATIGGYSHHLARDPNRTRISLPCSLDLTVDARVQIDFDIASLLNAPRPLSFARDGTATHSREGDPIAAALVANLPGSFRVRQILSAAPELTRPSTVKPLYLPAKFTPHRFTMSSTFPIPALPRDNPLLTERVDLGRRLFHEPLLSRDGSRSCASCHDEQHAFSDPRRFSLGVEDRLGKRHAMPLFNLAWKPEFFWDGRAPTLRAQALVPIEDPLEMDEKLDRVTAKLAATKDYPPLFETAFGSPEVTAEKLGLALENYLLTLVQYDSKFDRAVRGEVELTQEEKLGFELFMTENEPRTGQRGADCFHCHGGPLFTDHQFHNNGLSTDPADTGRHRVTQQDSDRFKFSTPTLRNIARTAPYMHDGRFATLEQVIDHYSTGVHPSPTLDPNLAKHPRKGLQFTPEERRALIAFLNALSDA